MNEAMEQMVKIKVKWLQKKKILVKMFYYSQVLFIHEEKTECTLTTNWIYLFFALSNWAIVLTAMIERRISDIHFLGSNKENKSRPKEENTEEDEIHELQKDENDQGNLDEDFSNDRNELKSDDLQPEDMNLADDLELDTQENDAEVGDGDSEFGEDNDEVEHDGDDEDRDGKDEGYYFYHFRGSTKIEISLASYILRWWQTN